MDVLAPETLPDDVAELKQMIVQLHNDNWLLKEQVQFFRDKLYRRRAEVWSDAELQQMRLFNEAEAGAEAGPKGEEGETIRVEAHERGKPGRRKLPEGLPRVEVVHDLEEKEKVCGCGAALSRIGEERSEQLDVIPAKVRVIRHIRYKYACKKCEGLNSEGPVVKVAPPAVQLIPKSMASAGLVAYVVSSKFEDALPFYRQEKQFKRIGVDLSRATMCGWAIEAANRCAPMMELLEKEVRAGPLVRADETVLQVLKEPGREATTKSYMWVFMGGSTGRPAVMYQYHPSRAGEVAREFLKDYRGYVQTDGYTGYNELSNVEGIVQVGCWAHVRRKFFEVSKASKNASSAHEAMRYIGRLYSVEHEADKRNCGAEERKALRQREAVPILEEFKGWLDRRVDQVPPQSLLGKAMNYALGQWERLVRYVENGILTPDNNRAENAIRPFVVGRKNWLFSDTQRGAHASATLYSLIETAKVNKIEPYWYLRYLFEKIPRTGTDPENVKSLLPQNLDRKDLYAQPP
jgi:transposase